MQHKYQQKTKIKYADLPELDVPIYSSKVHCPSCKEVVPATDLNIIDMVGKCENCDSIFSIVQTVAQLHSSEDGLITEEISRPEGIELNYFHNELEITAQQSAPIHDIIAVCLLPLVIFIGLIVHFKKGHPAGMPIFLISSAVFLKSVYNLMNGAKNKIFISINEKSVDVLYRPKNLVRDKSYPVDSISQAFVKADPSRGGFAIYLMIDSIDGQKERILVGGIKSELKAKYIEQEVERYLEIDNKKVIGEL